MWISLFIAVAREDGSRWPQMTPSTIEKAMCYGHVEKESPQQFTYQWPCGSLS